MPISQELIDDIKSNDSTLIDLLRLRIDNESAQALAGALEVNETITSLILADNKIDDGGVETIVAALKVNKNIILIIGIDNKELQELAGKNFADALDNANSIVKFLTKNPLNP